MTKGAQGLFQVPSTHGVLLVWSQEEAAKFVPLLPGMQNRAGGGSYKAQVRAEWNLPRLLFPSWPRAGHLTGRCGCPQACPSRQARALGEALPSWL